MNNQEKKIQPQIFDWLIKLFEFPAKLILSILWACKVLYEAKKRQFDSEEIGHAIVRIYKELVNIASFQIFLWTMPLTIIFWISLIIFIIFL